MIRATRFRQSSAVAFAIACAVLVSGCATDRQHTGSVARGKTLEQMTVPELDAKLRQIDAAYKKKPRDKTTGLTYALLLRMTGRDEQALAVMRQMVIYHPTDNQVLSAYGKALASTGNLKEALSVIERAQRPDSPDWRLMSAQGAILDQLEQPEKAREYYRRALDLMPNEPTILSNLGMSYLLNNDLAAAETFLRKANGQPRADSRVRQNLALVVGLQGRFDEAEKIAAAELPQQEAQANVDYLRKMLAQQNAWKELKQEDGATKTQ